MNFDIKEDEIHVWKILFLDFVDDVTFFTHSLSSEELARVKTYKFPADRQKFILGRGLLKYLLARYLDVQIQHINIAYGPWGKPCLTHKNKLYFNISHSGDYVLYAFTNGYDVGIDLEYIDVNLSLDEMVKPIFSKAELSYWEVLENKDKINNFFKYWAYKEAFFKASGKGWLSEESTLNFKEICLLRQKSTLEEISTQIIYPYFFNCFPQYVSALYVNGPPLRIRFNSLSHIFAHSDESESPTGLDRNIHTFLKM